MPANSHLSLPALGRAAWGELTSLEDGLPAALNSALLHPGELTLRSIEAREDAFRRPLRAFLAANLFFFVIGPSVGLFAFTLESLTGIEAYAEVVEAEVARSELPARIYQERFDATFRFRQPTFVILLVPVVAVWSKLLAPRRLFGEHIIFSVHALVFFMLAWPIVRLASEPVLRQVPPHAGPAFGLGLIGLLITLTAVYLARAYRVAFGACRWAAALRGSGLTVLLLVTIGGYGHLMFWITLGLLRL